MSLIDMTEVHNNTNNNSIPKIIYCKDCKYYEEFTDSISSKTTKGCTLYYVAKNENGFCDEAEERTNG